MGPIRRAPDELSAMSGPRQDQNFSTALTDRHRTSNPTTQSSTGIDHHRERPKLPTVDEAIDWYTEYFLSRDDKWGVTDDHFRGAEFFENMTAAPISNPFDDDDLVSYVEQIHAKRERLNRRMEMIAMNEPLKNSMHRELNHRLLALSNHQESTKPLIVNAHLGRKVATLYKQTHPIPDLPKNSVPALVRLKLSTNLIKVNLPFKTYLDEVYSMLRGSLQIHQPALSQATGETYDQSTKWTYRFIKLVENETGHKIKERCKTVVPLLCDMDYCIMMDHVLGKREPSWASVLLEMKEIQADEACTDNHGASKNNMGLSCISQAKRNEAEGEEPMVNSYGNSLGGARAHERVRETSPTTGLMPYDNDPVPDDDDDDVLDGDGKPYFDEGPIDWSKVYLKDEEVETDYPEEVVIRGRQGNAAAPEQQQKQNTGRYNLRPRR